MLEELRDRLAAMTREDAAAAILATEPKTSGKDLAAKLREAGHADVTPAEGKRLRRAVGAPGQAPVSDTPEGGDVVAAIRQLLADAVRVGDPSAIGQYTRALATLDGIVAPSAPSLDDWSALTEVEASALAYLTARARGEPLDYEAQWWQALFARVPTQGEVPHPAHVPLPAGEPIAPKLVAR